MTISRQSALGAVACVALLICACHRPAILGGKGKPPTGQVVATVNGREITLRELQAELRGVSVTDPRQMKAAQQRALQLIVVRTLMADAAHDQGLDKTPDFALLKQRAIDGVMAQAMESKVAQSVPAPAPEEVDRFISDNADIFAQRKVWAVDQIRFPRPSDPAVVKGLEPLKTLDDIAAYLTRLHIAFTRGDAKLDVVGMDTRLVALIVKLPPGELFVIPSGEVMLVNGIKSTEVVPLTGADAKAYATAYLKRRHTQEAVQRQISAVVSQGMKKVQFNPAYAPPPTARQPGAAPPPPSNAAKSLTAS